MSGLNFAPVVILKNSEPETLYILAEPFNECQKVATKSYRSISLFSVDSKVFVKIIKNALIDHREMWPSF